MPLSLVKSYLHIVFATKSRQPLIRPEFEHELYSYIGGICNNLECYPVKIGGHFDHIHILCMLSKKISVSKLLEEIKSHSSKWMKTKNVQLKNFYWQNGYGAFSVSSQQLDIVKSHIENQHEHHKNESYQTEFLSILKNHNLEYDERYMWD